MENINVSLASEENFVERKRRIKLLLAKDIGYTLEEISELLRVPVKQIAEDFMRISSTESRTRTNMKLGLDRTERLIERFPEMSQGEGARQCGVTSSTWGIRINRLIEDKRLPDTFLSKTIQHSISRKKERQEAEEQAETDFYLDDISKMPPNKMLELLEELDTDDQIDVQSEDLISPERIMRKLWVTTVQSVMTKKLQPTNFSEARALLTLMLEYKEAENERKKIEEQQDLFRPYKDASIEQIFEWIDDAMQVFYVVMAQKTHRQHIQEIRNELVTVHQEITAHT